MQARPTAPEAPTRDDAATLTISPEKVCFIILKAREFDVKDAVTEPDPASNPSDDRDAAVLEDHSDDPVVEELTSLIDSLSLPGLETQRSPAPAVRETFCWSEYLHALG